MFTGDEIYHSTFVIFYSNIIRIAFVMTFSSNIFLIATVIKKTPKFMTNLKVYLIPYACSTLVVQFTFLLYTPYLLHPYLYICPVGVVRFLPRNISLIILGSGVWGAIMFLGCSNAMAMERFFALKNIHILQKNKKEPSRIPYLTYITLSTILFLVFFALCIGVYIDSFNELIFIPPHESFFIVEAAFKNISFLIDPNYIVIWRGIGNSSIPLLFALLGAVFFFQVSSSLIITSLNIIKFYKLKRFLAFHTVQNNAVLLRIAYLQLFGIFVILGSPIVFVGIIYLRVSEPFFLVNGFIMLMSFYGFYDTFITVFCIRPYRLYFISFFKRPKIAVVMISSMK